MGWGLKAMSYVLGGAAKWGEKLAKPAWHQGGKYVGGPLVKTSEVASKVAFTATFAPAAAVFGGALKATTTVGKGLFRIGVDSGRAFGKSRYGAWKNAITGLSHENDLKRLVRTGMAFTGATVPVSLAAAYGINKLGNRKFVRDPRDRDPVNAMHLTQSLYNTLR